MNGEEVRLIEDQLQTALGRAVPAGPERSVERPPPARVVHLMAKAATAVLEAAARPAADPPRSQR